MLVVQVFSMERWLQIFWRLVAIDHVETGDDGSSTRAAGLLRRDVQSSSIFQQLTHLVRLRLVTQVCCLLVCGVIDGLTWRDLGRIGKFPRVFVVFDSSRFCSTRLSWRAESSCLKKLDCLLAEAKRAILMAFRCRMCRYAVFLYVD
jgi:hypothetical protein